MSTRKTNQLFVTSSAPTGAGLGDEWLDPNTGILQKNLVIGNQVSWQQVVLSPTGSISSTTSQLYINNSTAASSTISGALVVNGGVGIGGTTFISGVTNLVNTTTATNTFSGALIVSGGIGIGGFLFADRLIRAPRGYTPGGAYHSLEVVNTSGEATSVGTFRAVASGVATVSFQNSGLIGDLVNIGSSGTSLILQTANSDRLFISQGGVTTILATTASNSTITGALVVSGGVGIAGNTYVGGNVVTPNCPAFRVTGAGTTVNLSTTQNTNGVLNGNNYVIDFQQGTALNTSTGVFTAPIAGLYSVHLVARVSNTNNATSQVVVYKNSTQVVCFWEVASTSTVGHMGVSSITKLSVGDTLSLQVVLGTINFDANDHWSVAYLG